MQWDILELVLLDRSPLDQIFSSAPSARPRMVSSLRHISPVLRWKPALFWATSDCDAGVLQRVVGVASIVTFMHILPVQAASGSTIVFSMVQIAILSGKIR